MLDEKRAHLEAAFPGQTFTDEQIMALSDFVKVCTEGYEEEDDEMEMGMGPKKGRMGGPDLAIVLGSAPKGKKK